MDSRACVCTLISIHAPSRERHLYYVFHVYPPLISIHAPSRERQWAPCNNFHLCTISIHAPSRERLSKKRALSNEQRISIHAPSRERQWAPCNNFHLCTISIHAPSRERLPVPFSKACIIHISIHAPSRERLQFHPFLNRPHNYFNPRSLAGATWHTAGTHIAFQRISIHAPSRERQQWLISAQSAELFQSTLPRGSDEGSYYACSC